jgi:hypothetical protein
VSATGNADVPGPMPWSGSRGRSREIGYAEAMDAVRRLITDLVGQVRAGALDPWEVLARLAEYTEETRWYGLRSALCPVDLVLLGDWQEVPVGWIISPPGGAR